MTVKEAVVLILNGSGTYDVSEDAKDSYTKKEESLILILKTLYAFESADDEGSLYNASIIKTRAWAAVEQLCGLAGKKNPDCKE